MRNYPLGGTQRRPPIDYLALNAQLPGSRRAGTWSPGDVGTLSLGGSPYLLVLATRAAGEEDRS